MDMLREHRTAPEPDGDATSAWLTPSQHGAFARTLELLSPGRTVVLSRGALNQVAGLGATTVLKALRETTGGVYVDVLDVLELTRLRDPRYFEQSTYEVIRRAIGAATHVYLDNPPMSGGPHYKRNGLAAGVMKFVGEVAERDGKRVVAVGAGVPGAVSVRLPELTVDDYAHVFRNRLGEAASGVDFVKFYEFASRLDCHQLTRLIETLAARGVDRPTTRDVSEVSAAMLATGVRLENVEALSFESLIGFEDILRSLDQAVLLPLREPGLARQMGLEAKRGVLLHGPPGTGKTSVGRVLAHRMKGRFFMIDGDHDHEQKGCFYKSTAAVFEMARRNSPSVIFIDDADIVLGDPSMQQWGRYLLTKLDGLHSESAGKVCVMMTAMNLKDMPPALLRSGRLEVWLETRLPGPSLRERMLRMHLGPSIAEGDDLSETVELSEGFTPADMRAVVHDAGGFLAFDRTRDRTGRSWPAYLARAASDLRAHKRIAAAAAARRGSSF